jgi:uncharacterized membrane protein
MKRRIIMKNNTLKKISAALCAVSFSAALALAAPVATISAQAEEAVGQTITTREQIISYVYKIKDNKLYRCLYNYTTGEYVGDWVYVRDLDENGR